MVLKNKWIIGVDPDVEKSGVAFLDCETKELKIKNYIFPECIEYLRNIKKEAEEKEIDYVIVIEAGWLNKSNWHLSPKDSKAMAAAKGNNVGRNHETGRKMVEFCEYYKINYKIIKPLSLKVGKLNLWKSKDGKISHEELVKITNIKQRTNQEGRDAALIAWTEAGFSIKI